MTKSIYKKYFDFDSLVKEIKSYLPDFNEKLFKKAFEFAEKAHRGQLRKDEKTPYFVHPVKVVEILTNFHADEDILIAAMLHDVPEDTEFDIHEIEEKFGKKVAFLIEGITKLSKVQYKHNMPERQIESLKKLFLHSAKDPRIIIIKLADRLHNMRTLQYVKPEKRSRIARETLEIFVPVANLLGIQDLKSELEDHCFKYLFPTEYEKLNKIQVEQNKKHQKALKQFISALKKSFKKIDLPVEISERKQTLYTIYKKLSSRGKTLDEIEDRIAVRIITKSIPHCYEALGVVHGLYTPKISKFKDYIANPKINKYQSLHTMVFGVDGILTDVQIRTKEMHLEATYGIAANFFRDKNKITKDTRSSWVNKVIEIEKGLKASDDFLEDLKLDLFQERIFVFTPKGETIDLPTGASAIDFAYIIHTAVGDHAAKADINGNIVPITTTLKSGDVINIITDKECCPSLSWLSFAKTNLAKSRIHSYFKKIGKQQKIKEGHKILQKEFDIAGLGLIENISFKKINHHLKDKYERNFKNLDELYTSISEGVIKAVDIVKALKKPPKTSFEGIRVNVKVVAKNRPALLRDVSEVFYKHATDMTFLKAWTSPKNKNAYFNVQVIVDDLENIGNIFDELEQIDSVKHVYRIPYRVVYLAYSLVSITALAWVFHPLIFRFIIRSEIISDRNLLMNFLVYGGLFILFFLVMSTTHIMKNYVPFIRNKRLLWGLAFGIPALAVFTLLFELLYFHLPMSWLAIIIELLIIYIFLGRSFLSLKRSI